MEIIFKGIHPKEIWFKGTCNQCSSIARFQEKEGAKQADGKVKVECPVCAAGVIYGSKDSKQTATTYDSSYQSWMDR